MRYGFPTLRRDALICLRDEVPTALEAIANLSWLKPHDDTKPGASEHYAYALCAAGLRWERVEEWWGPGAWERRPRHLTTWADLAAAISDDPRRATIATWAETLTAPDRSRDLYRPYELWPKPETWHPSYIDGDHERPGWADRIDAWRTAQAILTDAVDALEPADLLEMLAVPP
jgi:hypothetical protein